MLLCLANAKKNMQSDQVLAKNFGEACGDDHVIMLLNNVSIDYYRVLLVKLITSFMTGWNSKGMQACLSRLKGIDSTGPLLNVLETFSTFCRCAGTLLQVAAVPTSVSAVEYFAAYKGPGIFEKAIQSILTREVDSQGRKVKSTVDSREMIQKMYKDVMRTAASTRVQQPQFDAILSALKEDEPKMTVLKEAWEKMPSFRSGLREGSCDPLEKQLFKVAKEKAEGLVTECWWEVAKDFVQGSEHFAVRPEGVSKGSRCNGPYNQPHEMGEDAQ